MKYYLVVLFLLLHTITEVQAEMNFVKVAKNKIIISVDPKSYKDRTYLRNQDGIIYYDDNY